jgi:SAM-dependent methyltransferase
LLLGCHHFLAPISPEPQKILDIGTGNGTWAIDIADAYPSARVIGVDLAPVAPSWVPPNCEFEVLDIEDDWLHKPESYDFIHGRELHLSIRDWPALIRKCYEHLKPGAYLELGTTVPILGCDDGTLPPDTSYQKLASIFFEVAEKVGADPWAPTKWKQWMIEAGFEDVVEMPIKMPSNSWPKDPHLKEVGKLEHINLESFAPAAMERGWTHVLGRDPTEIQVIMAYGFKEASNTKYHAYLRL